MNANRQQPMESEASFRLMFENNPLPMWIYDTRSGRFIAVNNAAIRHYGYSRDEFLIRGMSDLRLGGVNAEGPNPHEVPSGISITVTEQHTCKDGKAIDVELTWSRIEFTQRDSILVLAHDVTERRRAESQIREQANLINLAHDAIILRDFDDRVRFWNKGAERLYGYTSTEAIGQLARELMKAKVEECEAAQRATLETGEWFGEFSQRSKADRVIKVTSRWTLILHDDGSPKSILLINSDVTERKQLESQFLRTQRLESLGTLASGIAHDLNNILTPISMSIGVLRQSISDPSRLRLLNTVEVSAQRGAEIVRQVLTFARGVEGERVLLQPRHLIGELVKILSQTFPRNVSIKPRFPKDLWTVLGDATQLHQVLLNLCVNARDAMPEGGNLTVTAENVTVGVECKQRSPEVQPGCYVKLSVSDTGTGIPAEIIENIWDPFFTTKEQGKGTGLGLSTVVGIVQSHGGFLDLETGDGQGTTFKIFIPAKTEDVLDEAVESLKPVPRGNGENILVVDDEPSIREAASSILEAHGYHVFTAEDGTDALALYFQRRKEISLIITDIVMELMDGVTLTRSVKKLEPNVHVLVTTGQGLPEQRQTLKELGVSAIVEKPYTADTILRAIHEAFHPPESAETSGPAGEEQPDELLVMLSNSKD